MGTTLEILNTPAHMHSFATTERNGCSWHFDNFDAFAGISSCPM